MEFKSVVFLMAQEETIRGEIPKRYTKPVWRQTLTRKTNAGILTGVVVFLIAIYALIIIAASFQWGNMLPVEELVPLLDNTSWLIYALAGLLIGRVITIGSRTDTIKKLNDGTNTPVEESDSVGSPESQ